MAAELVDRDTGEVLAFPDIRIDRRFVILQQGREYILSDGLLDGLHQLSGGFFEVETRLEQLPNEGNGNLAVCSAKVTVYAPDGDRVLRSATGIGDASPGSVTAMVVKHTLRMAETRAVNRALRLLLNVGAVSFEELGPGGAEDSPSKPPETTSAPFTKPETIPIEGREYTRSQVLTVYKGRLAAAEKAGLAVPSDDAGLPDDAPLSLLVGVAQAIKRRLDAREGK